MKRTRGSALGRAYRAHQVALQEHQLQPQKAKLLNLLRKALPSMIPVAAVQLLAAGGSLEDACALIRPAPRAALASYLLEVAAQGWQHGKALGRRGRVIMSEHGVEKFAEHLGEVYAAPTAAEIARARAEAAKALEPGRYKPLRQETRAAQEEAQRMARSFRAIAEQTLRRSVARERIMMEREDPERLAALADALRSGGTDALMMLREERIQDRAAMQAVADIDWSARQRGQVAELIEDPRVTAMEYLSADDDAVTCVCQILDGGTISSDDPELVYYAPRLHFNCRCAYFPRQLAASDINWDVVQTFIVGEPSAGGRNRSITISRRQVRIPQSKPGQPPPKHCTDWISGRRVAPPPPKSLRGRASLERQRQEQRRRNQTALERRLADQ